MKRLVASTVTVIIALSSLTVSSAVAAKTPYDARWGCYETVTWKTNARPRMVKKQAKKINKHVNTFYLERIKSGRADINIKFVDPSTFSGNNVGFAHIGYILDSDLIDNVNIYTSDFGPGRRKATRAILVHELWHGVGMVHIPQSERYSIMNPTLNLYRTNRPTDTDWANLSSLDYLC